MKHLFTFRQRPNESLTHRGLIGSTSVVETTVKGRSQVSAKCRSTVGRLSTLFLLLALSFGFNQQAWAWSVTTGTTIYYDNSIAKLTTPQIHIGVENQWGNEYTFTRIGSTDFWYYYFSNSVDNYGRFKVHEKDNWNKGGSEQKYQIDKNCVMVVKASGDNKEMGYFKTYKKAYPSTRIYWDNSQTNANWSKVYLRYGFDCVNHAHEFSKFPGTTNLYYIDVKEAYYDKYTVSNNCGWTGANNVDQPSSSVKPTGTYAITKQLEYSATDINNGNSVSTFTISGVHGTSYDCTFYDYNISHGIPQHTVTIKKLTHGTITASYYGTDGNQYESKSKTDQDHVIYVPRTGQVKITLTTDNGYSGTLTVGGSAFTSGNTYTVTSDITISANVTPNKTTVTFAKNDGSESSFNVNVAYDSRDRIVVPNTSDTTRTGYTFNNYWTTTSGGTESNNKMTSLINSGQLYFVNGSRTDYLTSGKWTKDGGTATFYAHWSAKTYDIILEAGDYPNTTDGAATVKFDGASLTISTSPTRTGYNIAGTKAICSDAACQDQVATGQGNLKRGSTYTYSDKDNWNYDATGTVTLYMNWTPKKCALTFNNNGADTGKEGTLFKEVTFDASPTKITIPEKTNKVFAGYYTLDGTTSQDWGLQMIDDKGAFVATVTDYMAGGKWAYSGELTAMTLYAKWNEPQPKKVYFGITDGTNTTDQRGSISAKYTNDQSEEVTIESGVTDVPFGKEVTISWSNSVTAQYYAQNNAYNSAGWWNKANTTDAATRLKTDGNTYTVTIASADINAYVYAQPNLFNITVPEVEHGTASADPTQAGPHFRSTLTATPASGYDFTGWTIDNADNGKFVDGKTASDATTYVAAKAAVTVTPSYTIHSYSITYNGLQEGDENTNPANYTIETATIALANARRAGYTFDGWYDAETDGNQVTSIEHGSTGDKTLWARWHQTDFTVNFVVNPAAGGTITKPILSDGKYTTAHYNEPFDIEAQVNPGYRFVNWTSTSDIYLGVGDLSGAYAPARKLANDVELQTSSSQLASNAVLVAVDGGKQITANFAEIKTTLTVSSNDESMGTVSIDGQSELAKQIGVTTTATVMASNKPGYKFKEWILQGGAQLAAGSSLTDATITIKGDGTGTAGTAQAIFEEDLSTGVYLKGEGNFGGWPSAGFEFMKPTGQSTGNDAYVTIHTTDFEEFWKVKFALFDNGTTMVSSNYYFFNSTLEATLAQAPQEYENMRFFSTVAGDYVFHYNLSTKKLSIEYPHDNCVAVSHSDNSWTTYPLVNNEATVNLDGSKSYKFCVIYNGAMYANLQDITDSQKELKLYNNYESFNHKIWINTVKGGSYVFNFDHANDDHLTVTYPEETYQTVTVYKDGVTPEEVKVYEVSKPSITAQVPEGMNFNGWVTTGGAEVADASSTTTTVTNAGTSGTVKATFNTNQYIYFKDGVYDKFGNVWVTFRQSDYWDDSKGSGNDQLSYAALGMTKINNTDINYFHIDDAHKNWKEVTNGIVQFTNSGNIQQNFYYTKVAYPHHNNSSSCYRACLPLFVPRDWITTNINSSQYYNDGIWMKYNSTESGFRIKGSWDVWTSNEHKFVAETPGGYEFKTTLHLDAAGTTYDFKIYDDDNRTYSIKGVMTATSCTNWYMYMDQDNCQITTSEAGDYTFILNLGSGEVIVSVEYPLSANDYRVVAKDASEPKWVGDFIKHSSVAKKDTTSFYNDNYTFQLQQYNGSGWSDVAGQSIASTALPDSVRTQSVINFIVEQDDNNNAILTYEGVYKGNFYIRTDGVDGGWGGYETNADNVMSNYGSMLNAGSTYDNFQFDYYKAKWINSGKNVKFRIANDYSKAISDEFTTDGIINDKETLPQDANVRFMWNSKTNQLSRAYISGSTNSADRFLVLTGDEKIYDTNGSLFPAGGTDREGLLANETSFGDNGNWVYQVDIKANPSARGKLTAKYNNQVQYFKGSEGEFTDETTEQIIGGTYAQDTKYLIRTVYDFKTNRLVTAWLPENTDIPIVEVKPVNADIMLIRHAQEAAQAITFANDGQLIDVKTIYGAIELRKDSMVGRLGSWTPYTYSVCNYYVSFPFDVKVSEIFGIGSYGTNWQMQYYDGVKRAQIGWFAETSTFWTTLPGDATLKAHEGYLLQLNKNVFNKADGDIWRNTKEHSKVYIYFPSAEPVGGLSQQEVTVNIPEHICGIDRTFTQDADKSEAERRNHKITDTNWNVLGLPIFQNEQKQIVEAEAFTENLHYVYQWGIEDSTKIANGSDNRTNTLEIVAAGKDFNFKAMHGYMVQYAGEITWTGSAITPASIAARRLGNDNKNYKIELQVLNNKYARVSRTYIELDENANDGFQLNEDVYMMANSTDAGIYSFAGGYDVAANVLSINNHTIPLGIEVKKAGIYTIRMPRQFDGIATLIDHDDNTETVLNAYDYEAYLNKGTCEGRFELKLEVIKTTPTGINDKQQDNQLFKFIRNDHMYILRDGRLYNANGAVLSK